jgi:hypothetical protein
VPTRDNVGYRYTSANRIHHRRVPCLGDWLGKISASGMLRLGVLTSWNTRCGIAEYSRSLVSAMQRRGDVAVTVFGSRNTDDRSVREYEDWATPVFDVQIWRPDNSYDLDVDAVLARDLDVLHIQYSNLFYSRRRLVELMTRFHGVIALSYHDKVVGRRTFPTALPDLLYTHREDVGIGHRRLIPQGIDVRPPLIKTFGLGKVDVGVIEEICERNSWQFEKSFGEERWLEYEELFRWLRDCDAIVLWYKEDLAAGASAAAPLAIATRRPVFVNDTEWFRDLPDRTTTLRKVRDAGELEAALRDLLVDDYADRRSWDRVAAKLVADYRSVLDERADGSAGRERRTTPRTRIFALLDSKPLIKTAGWILPVDRMRHLAHRIRQHVYSARKPAGR